jgi:hypothetical protein
VAGAAIRLRAMFLLESEVAGAAQAFAVKFADIRRRHRVLHGPDPFALITIPHAAALAQLGQVLLNLALRLRAQYVERGDREEGLADAVAEAAGPLRERAAEMLELEGRPAESPREALARVAGDPLEEVSRARETGTLPPGEAGPALLKLIDLATRMRKRTEELS